MTKQETNDVAALDPSDLKPYSSFLILDYVGGGDKDRAVSQMMATLRTKALRKHGSREAILLAQGIDDVDVLLADPPEGESADRVDGFVYQQRQSPSWAKPEGAYVDVEHHLIVVYAHRGLLVVHAPDSLRAMVLRWIRNKRLCPPFRCVSRAILQEAFLAGEAKGLWLQGVHPTSTTKADAKHLSGQRLQDALSLDDSTFVLSAGRAALSHDPARLALRGTVGTTPGNALVWSRASTHFLEFLQTARDVLDMVHTTRAAGGGIVPLFPELATTLDSLAGVGDAYEFLVRDPDSLPPGISEETMDAARLLQGAVVGVSGDADGPNFTLSVGPNGSEAGKVRCLVSIDEGMVGLEFGYAQQPTHHTEVRAVLEALEHTDVFSIYYGTGQVIASNTISTRQVRTTRFPNWRFEDFGSFDITAEKPRGKNAVEIHDNLGLPADNSLFGWVVQHYSDGWLTCDDGPGEVADFIHLADDGTVSLIHVKASPNSSTSRGVAATPYEGVTSQAAKNLVFLQDLTALTDRLAKPSIPAPATWRDGERVHNRDELIDLLQCRPASDRTQIVVIQPHLTRTTLNSLRLRPDTVRPNQDLLRLRLLETMLTSARGTAVGLAGDLFVIGDGAGPHG